MADQQPRTRQELYDLIRQTSKADFILTEMKRLGFWEGDEMPKLPKELHEEKSKLNKEMQELLRKKRVWNNKEAILKEMRKKRMEEAKARREETKIRREKIRQEKARVWDEKKKSDIVYLGRNFSGGLSNKENDTEKIQARF